MDKKIDIILYLKNNNKPIRLNDLDRFSFNDDNNSFYCRTRNGLVSLTIDLSEIESIYISDYEE